MHLKRRWGAAAPAALGAATLLGALAAGGCGSSSSSGATARVRGLDLSVNGGTTGALVGSGVGLGTAVGGDLLFGQASSYQYIGQGVATFYASTTVVPPTLTVSGVSSTPSPVDQTLQLNDGSFYSAYVIGRTDVVPLTALKPDPRFLQCVVAGDKGAAANYVAASTTPAAGVYAEPPAGDVNIRILNAAPDAGKVDVLVGGQPVFSGVAYPPLQTGIPGTTVTAVNPTTAYTAVPAAALTVQVNAAGTATVLVPAAPLSVSAGQSYTLVVTEPTVAPTYGLSLQNDQ